MIPIDLDDKWHYYYFLSPPVLFKDSYLEFEDDWDSSRTSFEYGEDFIYWDLQLIRHDYCVKDFQWHEKKISITRIGRIDISTDENSSQTFKEMDLNITTYLDQLLACIWILNDYYKPTPLNFQRLGYYGIFGIDPETDLEENNAILRLDKDGIIYDSFAGIKTDFQEFEGEGWIITKFGDFKKLLNAAQGIKKSNYAYLVPHHKADFILRRDKNYLSSFLQNWIIIEEIFRSLATEEDSMYHIFRKLLREGTLSTVLYNSLDSMRDKRNTIIHKGDKPEIEDSILMNKIVNQMLKNELSGKGKFGIGDFDFPP